MPGTAGFIGKFFLIEASVDGDFTWLGIAIVVGSMLSLVYYLRVIAAVWMGPASAPVPAMAGGSPEADPVAPASHPRGARDGRHRLARGRRHRVLRHHPGSAAGHRSGRRPPAQRLSAMNERGPERTVLFHRIFDRFAGHHLKVWHYFQYVLDEPGYAPLMMMSDDSLWDESNPWTAVPELVIRGGRPHPADTYFFSGPVWQPVHRDQRAHAPVPVIHYMQSLRHALPDNIRYDLLENKAIRICVSEYVADSLRDTGVVRGPVFTIPAAIDVADLRRRFAAGERDTDLLIVATKQPEMGRRAAERLRAPGRTLQLIDRVGAARRVPCGNAARAGHRVLSLPRRGCAPADAGGHGARHVRRVPRRDRQPRLRHRRAQRVPARLRRGADPGGGRRRARTSYDALGPMLANASETVKDYDLPAERRAFIEILRDAERLWQE